MASAVLILLAFAGFLNEAVGVNVPVGMAPLIFVGMVLRMDGFHSVFRIGEEHLPNVDMT